MKKNIIKILFLMLTVLLIFSNFVIADTGTTIATTVRLREEPNSSSTTLMLIGAGKTVEILGEEDNWYEVEYEGVTGYISKDYISLDDGTSENSNSTSTNISNATNSTVTNNATNETIENTNIENETVDSVEKDIIEDEEVGEEIEEDTETEDSFSTIILAEDVDIRYMPSFTSNTSNTIGSGSEVTVLVTLNKWVKITDGNVTGWVIRQNI